MLTWPSLIPRLSLRFAMRIRHPSVLGRPIMACTARVGSRWSWREECFTIFGIRRRLLCNKGARRRVALLLGPFLFILESKRGTGSHREIQNRRRFFCDPLGFERHY